MLADSRPLSDSEGDLVVGEIMGDMLDLGESVGVGIGFSWRVIVGCFWSGSLSVGRGGIVIEEETEVEAVWRGVDAVVSPSFGDGTLENDRVDWISCCRPLNCSSSISEWSSGGCCGRDTSSS